LKRVKVDMEGEPAAKKIQKRGKPAETEQLTGEHPIQVGNRDVES
jgi:hypothetical protein